MTNLSVNINKIATLRNARGGNTPCVEQVAVDCEAFGADGITIHPRPDERHIRRSDVMTLRPLVKTEFNIEGYPSEDFINMVLLVKPTQVTLVPDGPGQLTSNHGWDVEPNMEFLTQVVDRFKEAGIRTSIFVGTDVENVKQAALTGTDRIELYTGPYAEGYKHNPEASIAPYVAAAQAARNAGMGVNAGHDLSLENLKFFKERIPFLMEVSIGHQLVCDALYMGLEATIKAYKDCIK